MIYVEFGADRLKHPVPPASAEEERQFVYEHLRYYIAKSPQTPFTTVRISNGLAEVTARRINARLALDLGRRVRASVDESKSDASLHSFLSDPATTVLNMEEEIRNEPVFARGWHVFYFTRPLEAEEQTRFARSICDFFETLTPPHHPVSSLLFSTAPPRAEFEATTPTSGEHVPYGVLLGRIREFSVECVPIASYQGLIVP